MKKTSLRLISAILAALLASGLLSACSGEKPAGAGEGGADSDGGAAREDSGAEETGPVVYAADIPEGTGYDGYGFRVAVADLSTVVWSDTDFSINEPSADIVENAVYERKRRVEQQLDVEISPVYYTGDVASAMKKSIQADENAFDIGFAPPKFAGAKAAEGWFCDLGSFPGINLEDPWWDRNSVTELAVSNKLFMAAGDIGYNYKRSTSVLFFNKKLIETNSLENPYELVQSNRWTLDKLFEMSSVVTSDVDGDLTISPADDRYGFAYCPDTLTQMLVGCGVDMTAFDENGSPEVVFMSDRTASVFEKITSMLYNSDQTYNWETSGVDSGRRFTSDMLLFMPTEFWVITTFRNMDTDFGVLPMPKYEPAQESYGHIVNAHVAALLLIPSTCTEREMTGNIVSALGAEGKNLMTPAYYELALKTKMSRDNESEAMFDIIFNSISWNAGIIYNWGSFIDTIRNMVNSTNTDIASTFERASKRIAKEISSVLEDYEKLG